MNSDEQPQFDFTSNGGDEGFRNWHEQRRHGVQQLARRLGLPLGRKVEVWVRGEIRLVGTLRLREERLLLPDEKEVELELIVDNVPFTTGEIVCCVAAD